MHHYVETAVGARLAPGEGVAVHHRQDHCEDTVSVVVLALDVSIWL